MILFTLVFFLSLNEIPSIKTHLNMIAEFTYKHIFFFFLFPGFCSNSVHLSAAFSRERSSFKELTQLQQKGTEA